MSDEPLLPLSDDEDAGGFDTVLRGYDKRQVEDYVERVEVALGEADRQHAEDGQRLSAMEQELAVLRERLADAEHRAAGLPESSARVSARAAEILRLAEEEADEIVETARARAEHAVADRTADLDRRSEELAATKAEADGAPARGAARRRRGAGPLQGGSDQPAGQRTGGGRSASRRRAAPG